MRSKNYQLMLLTGALTVSFAANAVEVKDNENTTRVEVKDNSAEHTPTPTDANVYGHVVDRKSGEHIAYATIHIKGTTIGCTTDKTGHYFLKNLPEGKFTLEVNVWASSPSRKQ